MWLFLSLSIYPNYTRKENDYVLHQMEWAMGLRVRNPRESDLLRVWWECDESTNTARVDCQDEQRWVH